MAGITTYISTSKQPHGETWCQTVTQASLATFGLDCTGDTY